MKIKSFLLFALFTVSAFLPASGVESGKVYRIVSMKYNKVVCEDFKSHVLRCTGEGDNSRYEQTWLFNASGSGFSIQNVYTGRYIANQSAFYNNFTTSDAANTMYVVENSTVEGFYNIKGSYDAGIGMHCNSSYYLVPWYCGSGEMSATEWVFKEVDVTLEEIAAARADYEKMQSLTDNLEQYNTLLYDFYTDASCSELKAEYAAMSDSELSEAMNALPKELINFALKIKNESWGKREKEFRIHSYEPYSNAGEWANRLLTYAYSPINNPTGIYANYGDVLYVFVEQNVPSDASLKIEEITGTNYTVTATTLTKGLNIIPCTQDASMLFINYTASTTGNKTIADFPEIKIHIENGTVNGYFDKRRHTDADWVDISQKLATHEIIQVKGEKAMYHMHRSYVVNACRQTVADAIGWWDKLVKWEHDLMGIGDVCPSKFNNLMLCTDGPDSYMYATSYHTYYQYGTLESILPWSRVYNSSGGCWGPAHEIGHVNQGAINIVGCTEVSNNLFSNMAIFNIGKYTTRGSSVSDCMNAFKKNIPFTKRGDVFSMTRMYYQLFLYYHAAKHDTLFYPKLFKALRETPLVHGGNVSGAEDQLRFAEKCCEVAGEDLSEFFEAWGFFVPVNNVLIEDYGNYYLTVTNTQIAATKAKMKKYAKKNGNIMFIEDRVAPSPRTDGVNGNRLNYDNDVAIGKMGDVGQWNDYAGEGAKAEGYTYIKAGLNIAISPGTGAVGFKVYDEEDHLIAMSNTYTLVLPESAAGKTLRFVAAQADGYDAEITAATGGTEEQQLAALTNVLEAAQAYIKLSNAAGTKVGYFYSDAVADLTALSDSATAAKTDKDQSVHTYGEWSELLNTEIYKLLGKDLTKIAIKQKNYYAITNAAYPSYGMAISGTDLICTPNTTIKQSDSRKKWEFIPAGGENEYYIRNKGGNFITNIKQSVQGEAASSAIALAAVFNVVDNGNGTFYLQKKGESMGCLHCDGSKNLVGWDSSNSSSHWAITLTENNSLTYELAMLDSLMQCSAQILNETTDTTANTPEEVTLLSNVYPEESETFAVQILFLYNTYNTAVQNYGKLKDYASIISVLREAVEAVQGKYKIMPDMPEASTETQITWYYLKSLSTESYCCIDTITARYMDNIKMEDLSGDKSDYRFWWCFLPTGREGEYYIYNRYQASPVYSTSNGYLKSDGSASLPYTLTLVPEKYGFTINDSVFFWNGSTTYARIAKMTFYWSIEKILTEENNSLSGLRNVETGEENKIAVYYDLYGRKIEKPIKKGLYIYNGKKIYIK